MKPTRESLRATQARMRAAGERVHLCMEPDRLAFRSGALAGGGAGSSIEYQDHRPFLLGDDPRDIDWRAYARTGQYTRKVYREEVSPRLDVALDVSRSMWLDAAKAERALELFYFCVEAGLRSRAALACHAITAQGVTPLPLESVIACDWPELALGDADRSRAPALGVVPWSLRAQRIWISDLLFTDEAGPVLAGLLGQGGRAIALVPYCESEASPSWSGSCALVDIEGGRVEHRQIDARILRRYQSAYDRHFQVWQEACRRRAIGFVRVAAEPRFEDALCDEAVAAGVVTAWT